MNGRNDDGAAALGNRAGEVVRSIHIDDVANRPLPQLHSRGKRMKKRVDSLTKRTNAALDLRYIAAADLAKIGAHDEVYDDRCLLSARLGTHSDAPIIRAGLPTARAPAGTSDRTTLFAPMMAPAPKMTSPNTFAPAPR